MPNNNLRFPLFIDIKNKNVLVVGGGKIATRRVKTLLNFECNITIVTLTATKTLTDLEKLGNGRVKIIYKKWQELDLDNLKEVFLITATTDNRLVNASIGKLAKEKNIYVSVADAKEESNFYFPAVATYETALVAIGSNGENHRLVSNLTKKIRELDIIEMTKPLNNTKILVTSPSSPHPTHTSKSDIVTKLQELGAEVDHIPTIKIVEINFTLPDINEFTWIVFTSSSGVKIFFEKFKLNGLDSRIFSKNKFAVVGSKTAKTLNSYGIIPDFTPLLFNGESLIEELSNQLTKADNILLIRPKNDFDTLGKILQEKQLPFYELPIYKTEHIKINKLQNLKNYDYVTFTSSSCVESFCTEITDKINKAVCIGDKTTATAKKYNMNTLTAKVSTIELLIEAIVEDRKKEEHEKDVRK